MKNNIKTLVSLSLLALFASIAACTSKPTAEREPSSTFGRAKLNEAYFFDVRKLNDSEVPYRLYKLKDMEQLTVLEQDLQFFLQEFKKLKDAGVKRDQIVSARESKAPYNKLDLTDGSLKDAAKYLLSLYDRRRKNQITTDELIYQIAQVTRAVQLSYILPVKSRYEFFIFPVVLSRFLKSPTVSEEYNGQDPDLKYVRDVFVQEKNIPQIDYAQDFFFDKLPASCQYEKAKRGYGIHAGFHIKCGEHSYKMKFGNEDYSGPFNSRMYRSLGYIAPHINYYEGINVDYDRRLLLEFNDRLATVLKITFAGLPVIKKNIQAFYNPFTFITGVKLKDGTIIDSATAQSRLFKKPVDELVTEDMIDANFEAQIDKLVFGNSTLTLKDDPVVGEAIGNWIPDDFNYSDFKEVRGIMLLAAWTGNFDIRKDNLSMNIVEDKDGKSHLRLGFGDAGSGLGKSTGFKRSGSQINDMDWEVSSVRVDSQQNDGVYGDDGDKKRIKLSGYDMNEYSKTFSNIKISDAQWMLRKICQISSEQLKTSLVASGLSAAETLLAQAKLLERRNKFIEHFDMERELKSSCYVPVNRKMNYDPSKDKPVTISYDKKSKAMAAPDRGHKIVNGELTGVIERKQGI